MPNVLSIRFRFARRSRFTLRIMARGAYSAIFFSLCGPNHTRGTSTNHLKLPSILFTMMLFCMLRKRKVHAHIESTFVLSNIYLELHGIGGMGGLQQPYGRTRETNELSELGIKNEDHVDLQNRKLDRDVRVSAQNLMGRCNDWSRRNRMNDEHSMQDLQSASVVFVEPDEPIDVFRFWEPHCDGDEL